MSAFRERGRILFFNHGRYAQAETEFLRALADDPDDAEAHALLGLSRNRLDRFDEALASCHEAIRLAPEWSYPHYALGYVLEKNNRLEEAAKALEEAIRISPHTAYFHSHLAFTRHRQGRYTDALCSAEEGLRCEGQHVDSLNRRAMALAALDRFEEAEQTSRTAVSLAPEDSGTLANLGYILSKRKKAGEALEMLREALRLDPSMTWSREVTVDTLVWLVEQGRADEAAKYMPDALLRDPHHEADRSRLLQAATKPILGRLTPPLTVAWLVSVAATAAATRQLWVFGALLVLGLIQWRFWKPLLVLIEPLSYPLVRRNAVARLFLQRRQWWAFVAVAAVLLATALAGAATVWTQAPFACYVLLLIHAQVLPIAYGMNPPTPAMHEDMKRCLIATLGFAGLMLFAVIDKGERILPDCLLVAEALFCWGVGGIGLVARLAEQKKR